MMSVLYFNIFLYLNASKYTYIDVVLTKLKAALKSNQYFFFFNQYLSVVSRMLLSEIESSYTWIVLIKVIKRLL